MMAAVVESCRGGTTVTVVEGRLRKRKDGTQGEWLKGVGYEVGW